MVGETERRETRGWYLKMGKRWSQVSITLEWPVFLLLPGLKNLLEVGDREWFGSKNNTCVSVSSGQFIQSVWGVRGRERKKNKREGERGRNKREGERRRNILWAEGIKISISLLKWDNVWEENILESSFSLSVCFPLSPSSESKSFSLTVKRPCFERNQKSLISFFFFTGETISFFFSILWDVLFLSSLQPNTSTHPSLWFFLSTFEYSIPFGRKEEEENL